MESARPSPPNGASGSQSVGFPIVRLLRYLYTNNPFYAISALLILVGLHVFFHDREAVAHPNAVTFNSWLLLALLGGYALLLAGTAFLIVRFGRVWDDARTILLTLLLLFVAMSVSFDKLILTHSATMTRVLLVGLVFSLAVSEGLIRGLGIRLPILFRGPFYLVLGLFFLYPIGLQYLLDTLGELDPHQGSAWTLWGIFFFPSVAAGITLTLLPAVWRGPGYVAASGTPWRWPLYPWSLFFVLGVGVVMRSYYLTVSFHPCPGMDSAFGVYFLVPLLLSISVVVFELGRSVGRPKVETVALAAPVSLLWLVLPGADRSPTYAQFLAEYMEKAGSPVLMTWWGLLALYLYAWARRARHAEFGVVVLLAVGSILGTDTIDVWSPHFPAALPVLVGTLLLVFLAILRPTDSARWFAAAASVTATLTIALWNTPFVAHAGAAPIHLLLGFVLMLGLVCSDAFARFLRQLGADGMGAAGIACLAYQQWTGDLPAGVVAGYLILLSLLAWGYWYTLRGKLQLVVAEFVTACLLGHAGFLSVESVRELENPTGAWLVFGGMASFVIASCISLLKVGLFFRLGGVPPSQGLRNGFPPTAAS